MMAKAWLGLGGNIGDVESALSTALINLDSLAEIAVETVSPLYKTPPWGVMDQPWFFNCCAEVETALSPQELLLACQEQERIGKRERKQRWGPRTIDIDILVFEDIELDEPRLAIPHPRMLDRAFVLVPLADIAPDISVDANSITFWVQGTDREGLELANNDPVWWRAKNSD